MLNEKIIYYKILFIEKYFIKVFELFESRGKAPAPQKQEDPDSDLDIDDIQETEWS